MGKIQTEIEALKQGNQDLSKKTEKVIEDLGKQLDTVRTNYNKIQVLQSFTDAKQERAADNKIE
jgi:hypothetical protein